MRMLKIVLAGLIGLWWVVGGLINLEFYGRGLGLVSNVLAMQGTFEGAESWRAMTNPIFAFIGLAWIVVGKLWGGTVAGLGACRMYGARAGDAAAFNAAARQAAVGCGIILVMLVGGFLFVANTWFMGWQSELGQSATMGALAFLTPVGIVMLLLNQPER